MMRPVRKPPLPRSPIRLRSRRHPLHSTANTLQTPPGSLTKTQLPKRGLDSEEMELRPAYHTISCELRALAKMVQHEFGNTSEGNIGFTNTCNANNNRSCLFERGRFYDEYSARRNERLKRKGEMGSEKKQTYDLGVRVESAKRRETKIFESMRKTVYNNTPMRGEERETPRYGLRSSSSSSSTRKEDKNRKQSLPLVGSSVNYEKLSSSVGCGGEGKVTVRKVRKN